MEKIQRQDKENQKPIKPKDKLIEWRQRFKKMRFYFDGVCREKVDDLTSKITMLGAVFTI
jgi:hypothetical protein